MNRNLQIRKPSKSYQIYNILAKQDSGSSMDPVNDDGSSVLMKLYNNPNTKRLKNLNTLKTAPPLEMGSAWVQPQIREEDADNIVADRNVTLKTIPMNTISDLKEIHESPIVNYGLLGDPDRLRAFSASSVNIDHSNSVQIPLTNMPKTEPLHNDSSKIFSFEKLAAKYVLGTENTIQTTSV